jgi:hypothetical protein
MPHIARRRISVGFRPQRTGELLVKADARFLGERPPANFSWFQTSANGSLLAAKSSADMSARSAPLLRDAERFLVCHG